ncbi:hypothetical protein A2U01_0099763, partial [Trifolium medium]|nr:hypothetical protein [Trifolium medium]
SESIKDLSLEEATTIMLTHELSEVLMGRVVAHKVAALAQAEEECAKKLQQTEESAANFKTKVEKVWDWMKEDKERR